MKVNKILIIPECDGKESDPGRFHRGEIRKYPEKYVNQTIRNWKLSGFGFADGYDAACFDSVFTGIDICPSFF